jgi:hypothetical protein
VEPLPSAPRSPVGPPRPPAPPTTGSSGGADDGELAARLSRRRGSLPRHEPSFRDPALLSMAVPALWRRAVLLNEWRVVAQLGRAHALRSDEVEALWLEHGGAIGQQLGMGRAPFLPTLLLAGPRSGAKHFRVRHKGEPRREWDVLMGDIRSWIDGTTATVVIGAMSWACGVRYGRRA